MLLFGCDVSRILIGSVHSSLSSCYNVPAKMIVRGGRHWYVDIVGVLGDIAAGRVEWVGT